MAKKPEKLRKYKGTLQNFVEIGRNMQYVTYYMYYWIRMNMQYVLLV